MPVSTCFVAAWDGSAAAFATNFPALAYDCTTTAHTVFARRLHPYAFITRSLPIQLPGILLPGSAYRDADTGYVLPSVRNPTQSSTPNGSSLNIGRNSFASRSEIPAGHIGSTGPQLPTFGRFGNISRRTLLGYATTTAFTLTSSFVGSPVSAAIRRGASDHSSSLKTNAPRASVNSQESVSLVSQSETTKRAVPSWGYLPENGPSRWASLSEEFASCDNIGTQSPIALSYRAAAVPPPAPSVDGSPTARSARPRLILAQPGAPNTARFRARLRAAGPGAQNRSLAFDVYSPPPHAVVVGDAPPVDTFREADPPARLLLPSGAEYALAGFHFHAPQSEHQLDGSYGVIEVHFVFKKSAARARGGGSSAAAGEEHTSSDEGREVSDALEALGLEPAPAGDSGFAVLGVLFQSDVQSSPWLRNVLDLGIPPAGESAAYPEAGKLVDVDLSAIMPDLETTELFSYVGSLTTPPGTEGVLWFVSGKRASASPGDVVRLTDIQTGGNVRPLQERGDRRVVRFAPVN